MKKIKIWKFIARLSWLCAIAFTAVLLVAGIRVRDRQKCSHLSVDIINDPGMPYLSKADIYTAILKDKQDNPLGKDVRSINMQVMEKRLEANPWITHAQVFLDNDNVLHVNVTQRIPLVKVFTSAIGSFYLDSMGNQLPGEIEVNPHLPLFTDYNLTGLYIPSGDSILLSGILDMGRFLQHDSFWNAQIEQVNILKNYNLELIPLVGKQVILFGQPQRIKEKFRDLLAFYRQVINKTDWETYDTINLSYRGEIVCIRNYKSVFPFPLVKKATSGKAIKLNHTIRKPLKIPKALYPVTHINHSTIPTLKTTISHD